MAHGGLAGAVRLNEVKAQFEQVTFFKNKAYSTSSNDQLRGGAVLAETDVDFKCVECDFAENQLSSMVFFISFFFKKNWIFISMFVKI